MTQDPIVEEVRLARARLFAECDEDLVKLMDRFEAAEHEDVGRVVTLEALRKRGEMKGTTHPTTG